MHQSHVQIYKSKIWLIIWKISSNILSVYCTASRHSRTEPGSDLLPFLFMLWRWRSRQRVQERQLEDTAIARQVGWGRVRVRCEAGRSFQGEEGNGRGGWRGRGRRSGGGAVLPVRSASPLPVGYRIGGYLMSLDGPSQAGHRSQTSGAGLSEYCGYDCCWAGSCRQTLFSSPACRTDRCRAVP